MGDELGSGGDSLLDEGRETARVVVVPVGQHHMGEGAQVDAHLLGVAEEHIGIAHIQQHAGILRLYVAAEGGLTQKILVDVGIVIAEDAQFHFFASCNSP